MNTRTRRHHRVRKKRTRPALPPGASPGTLIADPEAPKPVIRLMAYGPGEYVEQELSDLRSLKAMLGKWPVTWVNVDGLGDADTIAQVGEIFGLHRLALEDVLNVHQRPKLDDYDHYLFLVAQMVAASDPLDTDQLSMFQGSDFVVTFQEHHTAIDPFAAVRERLRKAGGRIRQGGADYLAYSLLDAVVDHYFPVLEDYGERLESLEDEVLAHPTPDTVSRVHHAKRDLLTLRRAMWPLREAVNALQRTPAGCVTDTTRLYVRDCYDHVVRIIDLIETYRELGSDLMDVYLSSLSNRLNEVMRILTVISTVFIPLTFITSLYGMNFNTAISRWNMPELNWRFGYPLVLAIMGAAAAALIVFFRRKGWLGASDFNTPARHHEEGGSVKSDSR